MHIGFVLVYGSLLYVDFKGYATFAALTSVIKLTIYCKKFIKK
jgi:hypothetical protein